MKTYTDIYKTKRVDSIDLS